MGTNDIGHYSLICKNTELFVRLEERLYEDFPQFKNYETFFEVKTRRIKREKPQEKNITKRLPVGPAAEQKIILNDKSEIKFYIKKREFYT